MSLSLTPAEAGLNTEEKERVGGEAWKIDDDSNKPIRKNNNSTYDTKENFLYTSFHQENTEEGKAGGPPGKARETYYYYVIYFLTFWAFMP